MINKAKVNGDGNIVIQDVDKSTITINMNDPKEIRKFFIDFQQKIDLLPRKILELMIEKNGADIKIEKGANIYLGLNFMMDPIRRTKSGISFSVTITNLTKENRFFREPFFKSSVPINMGTDTFVLTERINKIVFPKKLEYGEVISEVYLIKPESKQMYEEMLRIDENATIQVIASTTIGEVYQSNEYKVSQLLKNLGK